MIPRDSADMRNEHFNIHVNNPDINYVRINGCPYCIRERRNNYRNYIEIHRTSISNQVQSVHGNTENTSTSNNIIQNLPRQSSIFQTSFDVFGNVDVNISNRIIPLIRNYDQNDTNTQQPLPQLPPRLPPRQLPPQPPPRQLPPQLSPQLPPRQLPSRQLPPQLPPRLPPRQVSRLPPRQLPQLPSRIQSRQLTPLLPQQQLRPIRQNTGSYLTLVHNDNNILRGIYLMRNVNGRIATIGYFTPSSSRLTYINASDIEQIVPRSPQVNTQHFPEIELPEPNNTTNHNPDIFINPIYVITSGEEGNEVGNNEENNNEEDNYENNPESPTERNRRYVSYLNNLQHRIEIYESIYNSENIDDEPETDVLEEFMQPVEVLTNLRDINRNSTVLISNSILQDNNFENIRCTICLSTFQNNEIIRKLSCQHFYHQKCIDRWLENNKKCPLCRFEIDS